MYLIRATKVILYIQGGPGGRIVNISSLAGYCTGLSDIQGVGYTVSKHAVVALTRSFEVRV